MKTVPDHKAAGCRRCGSLSIDVRGSLGPHSIVRCGECDSVLSTWRSYLARATKDAVAVREMAHVRA
jgi:hypothetical protein